MYICIYVCTTDCFIYGTHTKYRYDTKPALDYSTSEVMLHEMWESLHTASNISEENLTILRHFFFSLQNLWNLRKLDTSLFFLNVKKTSTSLDIEKTLKLERCWRKPKKTWRHFLRNPYDVIVWDKWRHIKRVAWRH